MPVATLKRHMVQAALDWRSIAIVVMNTSYPSFPVEVRAV